MKKMYHYKLWQKNEIEKEPLSLEEIEKLGNRIQIFDLKNGWQWLSKVTCHMNKNCAKQQ